MSRRAIDVIGEVNTVAGYTTYIDLILPLLDGKELIATGMTREKDRVQKAIETVLSGQSCALISSGDPGIYAMAGLVFEMCEQKNISIIPADSVRAKENAAKGEGGSDDKLLKIEIVPGIPALCAGASILGSPISHDFATISLSDLLTPWEVIEKRVEAAAKADFVIVFYNPKSKKRNWQLEKAANIILKHRSGKTPTGIVTSAMRESEDVTITSLSELCKADVNMQSIVFVGNSSSAVYRDFMVTPRGYSKKYEL